MTNPEAQKPIEMVNHNDRFDENLDKKPGLVLSSFRGLLDGLVGGKKDEKTDKIRNDAMEKAKDAFRKLPREQQQEALLKIWNEANTQAYPTDTQKNPEDTNKKSDTRESFSEKMNEGIEAEGRKEIQRGSREAGDIAKKTASPSNGGPGYPPNPAENPVYAV